MKRALQFHSNAVWPRLWVVVTFAVVYGLFSAAVWLIAVTSRMAQADISDMQEMVVSRNFILAMAAGCYAVYRLVRFHPVCNRGYRAWMTLSPWTADKPLPLGPVHLVWQDAIVIGALTTIAGWHAHVNPLLPAGVFGLVYGGGMTLLLGITGSGILSGVGLPLACADAPGRERLADDRAHSGSACRYLAWIPKKPQGISVDLPGARSPFGRLNCLLAACPTWAGLTRGSLPKFSAIRSRCPQVSFSAY